LKTPVQRVTIVAGIVPWRQRKTARRRAKKKAVKGTYDENVWDHLAGTVSAPFEPGEHGQIAVKVIDDRWNELLVAKELQEAQQ